MFQDSEELGFMLQVDVLMPLNMSHPNFVITPKYSFSCHVNE